MRRVGTIGTIFSSAYDGSVGGVTKGRENISKMLSTWRSFPSIRYCAAKPNIKLLNKAPKRKTLVICQITKFGMLSLYSLKFGIFEVIASLSPFFNIAIAVWIAYQEMDDLFLIFTLINTIEASINAERIEYDNGFEKRSSNSFTFINKVTALLPIITKITIPISAASPMRIYFPASADGELSSVDELYKSKLPWFVLN